MPDAVFAHPKLAAVYDPLDPDRSNLDAYLKLVSRVSKPFVVNAPPARTSLRYRLALLRPVAAQICALR